MEHKEDLLFMSGRTEGTCNALLVLANAMPELPEELKQKIHQLRQDAITILNEVREL
jgi:hypothetical protein